MKKIILFFFLSLAFLFTIPQATQAQSDTLAIRSGSREVGISSETVYVNGTYVTFINSFQGEWKKTNFYFKFRKGTSSNYYQITNSTKLPLIIPPGDTLRIIGVNGKGRFDFYLRAKITGTF